VIDKMGKKINIKYDEIEKALSIEKYEFPKYVTQILNLVNQNAQSTRPKVVGQLSDLIQEFNGNNVSEWKDWYLKRYPTAIEDATNKVYAKLLEMKVGMNKIDKEMIRKWVEDLVITKTFTGLKFQSAIIKKIAELENKSYRLANKEEEAKGIDGFIGNEPVSIKPDTYKIEKRLRENIEVHIIYYRKEKNDITVEY
jgi:hypothetical protein